MENSAMVGEHKLVVDSIKDRFILYVKRKYTFIKGNSGTGKTYLCTLISRVLRKRDKVTKIYCDLKVDVLDLKFLDSFRDFSGILIADEDFVRDVNTLDKQDMNKVCSILNNVDAYVIFFSREPIKFISYSVLEAYTFEIQQIAKRKTVHRLRNLYEWTDDNPVTANLLVTEDLRSGYQFFSRTLSCDVIPARGNSSVSRLLYAYLENNKSIKNIFVVADGAAFGSYFEDLIGVKKSYSYINIRLFLPESFEYLILKSEIYSQFNIQDYLDNTENYADISKFLSCERYYTWLLEDLSKELNNSQRQEYLNSTYKKSELSDFYVKYSKKIYDVIEEIVQS